MSDRIVGNLVYMLFCKWVLDAHAQNLPGLCDLGALEPFRVWPTLMGSQPPSDFCKKMHNFRCKNTIRHSFYTSLPFFLLPAMPPLFFMKTTMLGMLRTGMHLDMLTNVCVVSPSNIVFLIGQSIHEAATFSVCLEPGACNLFYLTVFAPC